MFFFFTYGKFLRTDVGRSVLTPWNRSQQCSTRCESLLFYSSRSAAEVASPLSLWALNSKHCMYGECVCVCDKVTTYYTFTRRMMSMCWIRCVLCSCGCQEENGCRQEQLIKMMIISYFMYWLLFWSIEEQLQVCYFLHYWFINRSIDSCLLVYVLSVILLFLVLLMSQYLAQ